MCLWPGILCTTAPVCGGAQLASILTCCVYFLSLLGVQLPSSFVCARAVRVVTRRAHSRAGARCSSSRETRADGCLCPTSALRVDACRSSRREGRAGGCLLSAAQWWVRARPVAANGECRSLEARGGGQWQADTWWLLLAGPSSRRSRGRIAVSCLYSGWSWLAGCAGATRCSVPGWVLRVGVFVGGDAIVGPPRRQMSGPPGA
ncbi:hypothetical protein NDU88_005740 [Pleurodeles waltl]|uniref:Uncharacterized protein n=1 Tax=Pleurodeles waltl TaxID=8319 RepID=A0AAV7WYQ5_PLEWA|nr:hypothetical protein NDU88_005740 [Pleurodeles waltl]